MDAAVSTFVATDAAEVRPQQGAFDVGRVAVRPRDLVAGPAQRGHQQKVQVQRARAARGLLGDGGGRAPAHLHPLQDRRSRDRGGGEGGGEQEAVLPHRVRPGRGSRSQVRRRDCERRCRQRARLER